METTSQPRDVLEAMETVHWFLRLCFLNRVKSINSGGYILVNRFLPSLVFGMIYVATDLYFLVASRFKLYTNIPLVLMMEVLSSVCSILNFIVMLYKANCRDECKVRKEFDNINALDKAIGINESSLYKRDQHTVNKIFFSTLFVRITAIVWCALGLIYVFGIQEIIPFLPQLWAQFLQTSNYAYNISKLKLLNNRMIEMKTQFDRLCQINDKSGAESNLSKVKITESNISSCYLYFYENCYIFNKSQGLQILLAYTRFILYTMSLIGLNSKQKLNHFTYKIIIGLIAGPLALQIIDIILIILLIYHSTALLQTSNEISARAEKALVITYFESVRERSSWQEFVELTHRCPLVLTAYDFFPLDYSLIGATFGTIVTYTIIITQLNKEGSADMAPT